MASSVLSGAASFPLVAVPHVLGILWSTPELLARNLRYSYLPCDWMQAGAGFWLTEAKAVRQQAEALAKAQFAAKRDPFDCALMYIALGKRALLQVPCPSILASLLWWQRLSHVRLAAIKPVR